MTNPSKDSENMQLSVENITPQIAQAFLRTSRGNRKFKDAKVRSYARDMAADRWRVNGETIIFDKFGVLIDGHNRLKACVTASVSFSTCIVRGVEQEAQQTIDMGASRTVGDVLSFRGESNSNNLNAVILAAVSIANGRPRSANLSSQEVLDFLKAYPEVRQSAVVSARKVLPRAGAVIGAVHFAATMSGDGDKFGRFFQSLSDGIPAYEGCPAHCVRERILRDATRRAKMSLQDVHRLVIAAWNKFRIGASVKNIKPEPEYKIDGFDL